MQEDNRTTRGAAKRRRQYGVEFRGSATARSRHEGTVVQFKTNCFAMSVLEKNGLGDWLADRIVEIGDQSGRPHAGIASRTRSSTAPRVANFLDTNHQSKTPQGREESNRAVPQGAKSPGRAARFLSLKWAL